MFVRAFLLCGYRETEYIHGYIFTSGWVTAPSQPRIVVGGHEIPIRRSKRYLGVELDRRLRFTRHVDNVANRAGATATAVSRLMANKGNPSQAKLRLISTVVHTQQLYATPNWTEVVTKTARNVAALRKPQRTVELRVIRAYRTVSDEAA